MLQSYKSQLNNYRVSTWTKAFMYNIIIFIKWIFTVVLCVHEISQGPEKQAIRLKAVTQILLQSEMKYENNFHTVIVHVVFCIYLTNEVGKTSWLLCISQRLIFPRLQPDHRVYT